MLLLRKILATKAMVLQCAFSISTGSLGARSYPLSYVYPGLYYWGTGRLYYQALYGGYWSSTIYNSSDSYSLVMTGSRLIKAGTNNKRLGSALRCMAKLYTNLVSAHWSAIPFLVTILWVNITTSISYTWSIRASGMVSSRWPPTARCANIIQYFVNIYPTIPKRCTSH